MGVGLVVDVDFSLILLGEVGAFGGVLGDSNACLVDGF